MTQPTSTVSHIATVAVYVDDQDRALDFWTRQVGLEKKRDERMDATTRWIEVGPARASSCLVIYPKAAMPDWAERKPSVVWQCDDVDAAYSALSARGVRFEGPPQQLAHSRFAIFLDSEGNKFGLRE